MNEEQNYIINNIVESMKPVTSDEINLCRINNFYIADPGYRKYIAENLVLYVLPKILIDGKLLNSKQL